MTRAQLANQHPGNMYGNHSGLIENTKIALFGHLCSKLQIMCDVYISNMALLGWGNIVWWKLKVGMFSAWTRRNGVHPSVRTRHGKFANHLQVLRSLEMLWNLHKKLGKDLNFRLVMKTQTVKILSTLPHTTDSVRVNSSSAFGGLSKEMWNYFQNI